MPTRLRQLNGARPEVQKPTGKRLKATADGWLSADGWLGTEADALDVWLRRSLHAAFDAVAAEPIPEDILRMIEEDRAERESVRSKRVQRDDE